jgi:hypothetical protein
LQLLQELQAVGCSLCYQKEDISTVNMIHCTGVISFGVPKLSSWGSTAMALPVQHRVDFAVRMLLLLRVPTRSFLRSVLGSSPGMTWKIETDNTSVTELSWLHAGPAAGWHLNRVNDTAHLLLAGLTGKLQEGPPQLQQPGSSRPTEAAAAAAAASVQHKAHLPVDAQTEGLSQ